MIGRPLPEFKADIEYFISDNIVASDGFWSGNMAFMVKI